MEHALNIVLIVVGSGCAVFFINDLIRQIQDSRKPKRAPINTDVFKTFKHRKKDRDDEEPK